MIAGHKPKYERAEGIVLNEKELRYLRLDNTFTPHPVHADDALIDFMHDYSKDGMRTPSELYSKVCQNFNKNLQCRPNMR